MIVAALVLIALGVADICKPRGSFGVWPIIRAVVISSATLSLLIIGSGLNIWWVLAGVQLVVAWIILTAGAMHVPRLHLWPLVGLLLALLGSLALDPMLPSAQGWIVRWYESLTYPMLQTTTFNEFLFAAGCALFLLESSNLVVRMVLFNTAKQVLDNEGSFEGGRLLGPVERLFIFAMALAGQFLAIGAVVAAKGIIRFPELTADDKSGTKAEYVLVGSFVSWGLALLAVPLLIR